MQPKTVKEEDNKKKKIIRLTPNMKLIIETEEETTVEQAMAEAHIITKIAQAVGRVKEDTPQIGNLQTVKNKPKKKYANTKELRQKRKEEIIRLRKEGKTYSYIQDFLGISSGTVWLTLNKVEETSPNNNEENDPRPKKDGRTNPQPWTTKQTKQIKKLISQGKSHKYIANLFGVKHRRITDKIYSMRKLNQIGGIK